MKKGRVVLATFIITLFLTALIPVSAYANIPYPDGDVATIDNLFIYRNVLETGDFLAIAQYNVPYASPPTLDISQTFLFRFMDQTNTVELGVVEAYPYHAGGYNKGVVSWYWPASTAPAWNQPYNIKIQGKVSAFASPHVYNSPVPLTAYSPLTLNSAIQTDIGLKIIIIGNSVGTAWNLLLVQAIDTGTYLTSDGQAYLSVVIPGLQNMCPPIFQVQTGDPTYTTDNWSNAQVNSSEQQFQGTDFGNRLSGLGSIFNIDALTVLTIPIVFLCIVLFIVSALQGNWMGGISDSGYLIVAGSWAGWFPMALMALIAFGCAVFIGYHLIWKSS